MGFSPIHRARFSQLPTILLALTVCGSLAAPKAYAQQAEPSAPAHLALGDAYLQMKDVDAAKVEAERALSLEPASPEARQLLSRVGAAR